MDEVSLLWHHMYRFKSYGFFAALFKGMQYTDSELGDSLCQILQDHAWDAREFRPHGGRILIITSMKSEWFQKKRLLIIQFHNTIIPY
jgi:hypothetical protein